MMKNNLKPRRGRPSKLGRDDQDTRQLLIRSGLEQLTAIGFVASGIDSILKKVGVPKGSFYHYFASKEAFGQAVINEYASYFASKLDQHLLAQHHQPLQRIQNFVEDAKLGMQRHNFSRGCLIGNLGQEVDTLPVSYRPQLIAVFQDWQQRLSQCLELAKQQDQLSASANSEKLAEFFWIGWEGAVSRAKLVKSSEPLDNFLEYFIAGLPK